MKPAFKYLLIILLLVALAPYFIICFYAFPFADDFCFGWTASQNISFLQKFLNQYLLWNGRYTADVLVNLHPLVSGKLIYYQLAIFASLFATPVVLYLFIREVLHVGQTDVRPGFVSFISLLITLVYLNYQPNITEGVYWFIGVSNYHLGNLLFLLQLTLRFKSFSATGPAKVILNLLSVLLLIVSIGFNEIGAVLIPCFYFTIALLNWQKRNDGWQQWLVYAAIAIVASGFVFFSPGNFVRSHEFEKRFDLLHSFIHSAAQTIRFLAYWLVSIPFALLSVVVIANAHVVKNRIVASVDYRLIIAGMLFVVFIGSFLPYFATGMLGQHRTINFVFFFFILLWLLLLLSVSHKFSLYSGFIRIHHPNRILLMVAVSIVLMLVTRNGIRIVHDISNNAYQTYRNDFFERQQAIIHKPHVPYTPLKTTPAIFQIVDVRGDTSWWVDKCMRKYYLDAKMELK